MKSVGICCLVLTLVLYTQAFAEPASSTPAEMISNYRVQHGEGRVTLDPALNRIETP